MSDQLTLPGFERQPPSQPTDRLFLGVFLHPDAAAEGVDLAWRLRKELNLRGMPLPPERLHITLHHIGDYTGLPPQVVTADTARQAPLGGRVLWVLIAATLVGTIIGVLPFVILSTAHAAVWQIVLATALLGAGFLLLVIFPIVYRTFGTG